jgi:hypothetical protein
MINCNAINNIFFKNDIFKIDVMDCINLKKFETNHKSEYNQIVIKNCPLKKLILSEKTENASFENINISVFEYAFIKLRKLILKKCPYLIEVGCESESDLTIMIFSCAQFSENNFYIKSSYSEIGLNDLNIKNIPTDFDIKLLSIYKCPLIKSLHNLPIGLEFLYTDIDINVLDLNAPELIELRVYSKNLKHIISFPHKLRYLKLYTDIEKIPIIPDSVKTLILESKKLKEIPNIPKKLELLVCDNCTSLVKVPELDRKIEFRCENCRPEIERRIQPFFRPDKIDAGGIYDINNKEVLPLQQIEIEEEIDSDIEDI